MQKVNIGLLLGLNYNHGVASDCLYGWPDQRGECCYHAQAISAMMASHLSG